MSGLKYCQNYHLDILPKLPFQNRPRFARGQSLKKILRHRHNLFTVHPLPIDFHCTLHRVSASSPVMSSLSLSGSSSSTTRSTAPPLFHQVKPHILLSSLYPSHQDLYLQIPLPHLPHKLLLLCWQDPLLPHLHP